MSGTEGTEPRAEMAKVMCEPVTVEDRLAQLEHIVELMTVRITDLELAAAARHRNAD